jgi:hypothetical protein
MRVGDEIEVDRVRRNLRVLDPEVTEQDPQQLHELHGNEQWPEADTGEPSLDQ